MDFNYLRVRRWMFGLRVYSNSNFIRTLTDNYFYFFNIRIRINILFKWEPLTFCFRKNNLKICSEILDKPRSRKSNESSATAPNYLTRTTHDLPNACSTMKKKVSFLFRFVNIFAQVFENVSCEFPLYSYFHYEHFRTDSPAEYDNRCSQIARSKQKVFTTSLGEDNLEVYVFGERILVKNKNNPFTRSRLRACVVPYTKRVIWAWIYRLFTNVPSFRRNCAAFVYNDDNELTRECPAVSSADKKSVSNA